MHCHDHKGNIRTFVFSIGDDESIRFLPTLMCLFTIYLFLVGAKMGLIQHCCRYVCICSPSQNNGNFDTNQTEGKQRRKTEIEAVGGDGFHSNAFYCTHIRLVLQLLQRKKARQ
jgi:hypothetical protein